MKGNRIRQARLASGLTLVALGEKAGPRQTYATIEFHRSISITISLPVASRI